MDYPKFKRFGVNGKIIMDNTYCNWERVTIKLPPNFTNMYIYLQNDVDKN